jgi:hypothetical protein
MVSENIRAENCSLAEVDFVAEQLGLGIKGCEVALSSASAATWDRKIRDAQRAHDTAQRFVHRFRISEHKAERINNRIVHLKTLLEELK